VTGDQVTEVDVRRWQCLAWPYVYDPEIGDPEADI